MESLSRGQMELGGLRCRSASVIAVPAMAIPIGLGFELLKISIFILTLYEFALSFWAQERERAAKFGMRF
jgi:hypothetical protein